MKLASLAISDLWLGLSSYAALGSASPACKCSPGDLCWPAQTEWAKLNETVGGRLVGTIPLGSPCHDPVYNEAECASLQSEWLYSGVHMESSSSIMAPLFANQSCDPWQPEARPCTLGNYVSYAVNLTGAEDAIETVKFAKEHNVRLVIRNTGHDYLGRSTGAGALAAWTHHLKGIEVLDWQAADYQGKALKVGAGVQGFEALEAASNHGLVVITGECPTVGLAGGYTQGGGHSGLSTSFGLSADNTLEFEVVTAAGQLVTASKDQNADLYWALSGSGSGNYGIVISMVVKAHPESLVSGASFALTLGDDLDSVFEAVDVFHESLPAIVDAGVMVIYFFGTGFFQIPALTAYGKTKAQLQAILSDFGSKLDSKGLKYSLSLTESPTYYEHYNTYWGPLPLGNIQVGTDQYGGRLIFRSHLANFSSTARALAATGTTFIGVGTDVKQFGGYNAVLPAWRDAIVHASLAMPFNFTAPWSETLDTSKKITDVVQPIIEAATPGSGAYINEADWRQPNWQQTFYGSNYDRLLLVKKQWDPEGLFYAVKAVGSEAYQVTNDGRLCST